MKHLILIIATLFNLSLIAQVKPVNTVIIPKQAGNAGKYLKTNGSKLIWDTPSGGSGSSTLAQILANGSKTNSLPIYSNNELSFCKISNDSIELSHDDGISGLSNIKLGGGEININSINSNNFISHQNNFLAPNGNYFTGFISAETGLDAFTTPTLNIGTTYADYIKLGAVTNTLDVSTFNFTHNTSIENYPNLTANKLLYLDASKDLKNITLGSGLSLSSGTLSATGSTSYSNIKYTDGALVTSSLGAITDTLLIPANTFTGNCSFYVQLNAVKTGSATVNSAGRIYVNTTPVISGSYTLAAMASQSNGGYFELSRTINVKGSSTIFFNSATNSLNGNGQSNSGAFTSVPIDWTVNQYIIFVVYGAAAEPAKSVGCIVRKN